MTGAVTEEDAVVGERSEEDPDRWGLRSQLVVVLGVVAVLELWWAIATGRMAWPSPPLPLPL